MIEWPQTTTHTDIAAYVGAITGTLALGWAIVKTLLENRVGFEADFETYYISGPSGGCTHQVRVTSTGRAVSLSAVWLARKRGLLKGHSPLTKFDAHPPASLPFRLESHASWAGIGDMDVSDELKGGNPDEFEVLVYYAGASKPKRIRYFGKWQS